MKPTAAHCRMSFGSPALWRVLQQIVKNPAEILANDPALLCLITLDAQQLSPEDLKP